jgi:DNA-binding MarR family transcriptional regulator
MADINSQLVGRQRAPAEQRAGRPPAAPRAQPSDPNLITFVELLFFAYRDFTREADAVLAEYDLGRAHHRVLHFVNRHPGLRVADLLEILKITKQSLARVLKELVDKGWIAQKAGERDRRQRLLNATAKGATLAGRLDALQSKRVAQALEYAGSTDDGAIARFLFAMISTEERSPVQALLPAPVELAAAADRD